MGIRIKTDLEKAKEYYQSLRLPEAYTILRRFYDRIPFEVTPQHAEHISLFVRVLHELGKTSELKFYIQELEKHRLNSLPEIQYQLAVAYTAGDQSQLRRAKLMLEDLLKKTDLGILRAKAKVFLAYCHDTLERDTAACHLIIESIGPVEDPDLAQLIEVWRAKISRDQGKVRACEEILERLFLTIDPQSHWYVYNSALIVRAGLYIQSGDYERAIPIVKELRERYEAKPLVTIKLHLDGLQELLQTRAPKGVLHVSQIDGGCTVSYQGRTRNLVPSSALETLLVLLGTEGKISKRTIVEKVYGRAYRGLEDDRLAYVQVGHLKKFLRNLGLSSDSLVRMKDGYQLTSAVELVKEGNP